MNKKRTRKFKQGIFTPYYPEKYKGSVPIVYRSSYELVFMRWCDHNPNVVSWGSETVIIPYNNPLTGRKSRYFTDMNVTIKDKHGMVQKYLVEIKPAVQTLPPVSKKQTKAHLRRVADYVRNQAKWIAADDWAKKHGYSFVVLTEKHLGIAK